MQVELGTYPVLAAPQLAQYPLLYARLVEDQLVAGFERGGVERIIEQLRHDLRLVGGGEPGVWRRAAPCRCGALTVVATLDRPYFRAEEGAFGGADFEIVDHRGPPATTIAC